MPDWMIEVDTEFTGLDEDGLVRFADAFERGFGYMGPACALENGRLSFTVTVTAATWEEGAKYAFAAAQASLSAVGVPEETEIHASRVNLESAQPRELVVA
jgi:hypothetical protein